MCASALFRAGVKPNMTTALIILYYAALEAIEQDMSKHELCALFSLTYETQRAAAGGATFALRPDDSVLPTEETDRQNATIAGVLYDPRLPPLPDTGRLYVRMTLAADLLWGLYGLDMATAVVLTQRAYDRAHRQCRAMLEVVR